MVVRQLWLRDLRIHEELELSLSEGLTVIHGPNGVGKSTVLEAVHYLATLSSFRASTSEALVRRGADQAIIRGELLSGSREVLIEASVSRVGRDRVLVNKQALRRTRDLADVLRTTVFSPDDLVLVKGGPAERRQWLDNALGVVNPRNAALIDDVERILRQRGALLRQCGGRLSGDDALTLDVWDSKLAETGTDLAVVRQRALADLLPWLVDAVQTISGRCVSVEARYVPSWSEVGLAAALNAARHDDIRRGVSTVGPHRDDVAVLLDGRPSRTEASQGEQRTLALSLRLSAHLWIADQTGEVPVLLLDDVFSELDPQRCAALLGQLPPGQALLATANAVPEQAAVNAMVSLIHTESTKSVGNPVDTVDKPTVGRDAF